MDAASLLLPILLIAVFYFLLIRPQQRQRRQMANLQQSLEPGSRVMTTAGMLATVVAIEGDEVVLEVAPGVHSRFVRRAIGNIIPPEQPTGPDDNAVRHEPAQQQEDRTNGDDSR